MGKRILKFFGWAASILGALAVVFVVVVLVRSNRTFESPYPDIHASNDPALIARGRYIAYGPGHCVNCHTNKAEGRAAADGATPPLAGGGEFVLPLGVFRTPNLTPDRETGIARYSDRELARVLRYGVMPDGRVTLPFMEFHELSNEDLTAVISFLRSQQPVRRAIPRHEITFLGKAVLAFLIKPIGPKMPPLERTPAEAVTVERGAYMANSVAGCAECHTRRSRIDGSYIADRFSGGMTFEIPNDPKRIIVSPNLTPSKYGRITNWTEDQFVGRFGAGVGIPHTHMPWRQFQRMSETDVRAIYRYLRTLPPTDFDPGPSVQVKTKA